MFKWLSFLYVILYKKETQLIWVNFIHFGITFPFSFKISLFVRRLQKWFRVRASKLWPVCQFQTVAWLFYIGPTNWGLIYVLLSGWKKIKSRIIFNDLWKLYEIPMFMLISKVLLWLITLINLCIVYGWLRLTMLELNGCYRDLYCLKSLKYSLSSLLQNSLLNPGLEMVSGYVMLWYV